MAGTIEYNAAYYAANRDRIAAQQKAYREANRDRISAQKRARRDSEGDVVRAVERANYAAKRDRIRARERARRFGMSPAGRIALLERQGNACAICRAPFVDDAPRAPNIDHDHRCCPAASASCGACVRGALCHTCNVGLGAFRDDPAVLEAAARYLRSYDREG